MPRILSSASVPWWIAGRMEESSHATTKVTVTWALILGYLPLISNPQRRREKEKEKKEEGGGRNPVLCLWALNLHGNFRPSLNLPLITCPPPSAPSTKGGLCRRASLLSLITSSGLPEGDYTHNRDLSEKRMGWTPLSLSLAVESNGFMSWRYWNRDSGWGRERFTQHLLVIYTKKRYSESSQKVYSKFKLNFEARQLKCLKY